MGFLKKAASKLPEMVEPSSDTPVDEVQTNTEVEEDDFDTPSPASVTREEFHKMAENQLEDMLSDSGTEDDTEPDESSASDEDTNSDDDSVEVAEELEELIEDDTAEAADAEESNFDAVTDDFDSVVEAAVDEYKSLGYEDNFDFDSEEELPKKKKKKKAKKIKKEKKPRMTFSEFCSLHKSAVRSTAAVFGTIFAILIGIYIYGCATVPSGVMGRNIYIEDIDVSNLTYEEALSKVQASTLLDNCNLTLISGTKSFEINGLDVGLTAEIEHTVDKTMRYGKTGNILIDGFANALQLFHRHTVLPSADVNDDILKLKIAEFGNAIYGELVEHKLEIGDGEVICTPGHTGFSADVEQAYNEVIEAINNENFSKIRVTLKSAPPADLTVDAIDAFTYSNPQNAYFDVVNNEVVTVPETYGRYLDLDKVQPLVEQIKEGGEIVKIPFNSIAPEISAEALSAKLFNATLGSYKTSFGGSSANRAGNVANAASKINGKILAPGEVFSFNDTVGKRSVANGFYPAPEYANGATVIGIGGGTCQVSSTLYNAVLYADLSIVSRLNHMFPVGYCPLGQDATVSDSGVDFKFSNNTDYPIKVVATTGGGVITISILGTERDVKHEVKIENSVTYSGGNKNVRSYRYVYDPNGTLIRKDTLDSSYYMAH